MTKNPVSPQLAACPSFLSQKSTEISGIIFLVKNIWLISNPSHDSKAESGGLDLRTSGIVLTASKALGAWFGCVCGVCTCG